MSAPPAPPLWLQLVAHAESELIWARLAIHRQLLFAFRGDAAACRAAGRRANEHTRAAIRLMRQALTA